MNAKSCTVIILLSLGKDIGLTKLGPQKMSILNFLSMVEVKHLAKMVDKPVLS